MDNIKTFPILSYIGLLGDATEDIVEHLDKNNRKLLRYKNFNRVNMSSWLCSSKWLYFSEKGVDNEIVYKMANVMNECGGLEAILKR